MNRTDKNIVLGASLFAGFWVLCFYGWFVSAPLWGIIAVLWMGVFILLNLTESITPAVPMIMSAVTMFLLYLIVIRRIGLR
jgi:hypothetical protein